MSAGIAGIPSGTTPEVADIQISVNGQNRLTLKIPTRFLSDSRPVTFRLFPSSISRHNDGQLIVQAQWYETDLGDDRMFHKCVGGEGVVDRAFEER